MHKDELLELHEQMVTIMEHFRAHESVDSDLFDPYDELEVDPSHVHKSKSEHKHAVFVLGERAGERHERRRVLAGRPRRQANERTRRRRREQDLS